VTLDPKIAAALRALDPGPPPADLAERAFRRAVAEGRPVSFVERFVLAGRRLVLVGVVASAAVWAGLLLRGDDPSLPETAVAPSPIELSVAVWSGDEEVAPW
jgi:hypothetical protein